MSCRTGPRYGPATRRLGRRLPADADPSYRYRRLVWQREGYRSETFPMVHELAQQGLSNASLLAAPAMLAVADRGAWVGPVVVAGVLLWAVSWALESLADLQKARFLRRSASAGATLRLADDFAVLPRLGFGVALLGISGGMYHVLVHGTGAIPADHFSVQHRPDYRDYQERVSRLFPGPNGRTGPGP